MQQKMFFFQTRSLTLLSQLGALFEIFSSTLYVFFYSLILRTEQEPRISCDSTSSLTNGTQVSIRTSLF